MGVGEPIFWCTVDDELVLYARARSRLCTDQLSDVVRGGSGGGGDDDDDDDDDADCKRK